MTAGDVFPPSGEYVLGEDPLEGGPEPLAVLADAVADGLAGVARALDRIAAELSAVAYALTYRPNPRRDDDR